MSGSAASGGIGLCGLTFIVFLILKLAEVGQVASWSWLWVTAPLWGPFALVMTVLAAMAILSFFAVRVGSR